MKQHSQSAFRSQLSVACNLILDRLLQDDDSVLSAAIASMDGFEIAHRSREGAASTARLAAITSSLSSLASAAASELKLGALENLVVDSGQGRMLLLHISARDQTFTLAVVASKAALLGKVLLSARECALNFSKSLDSPRNIPHPS